MTGRGFRPRSCGTCSSVSIGARALRAAPRPTTAGRGSGWRSCARSSSGTAEARAPNPAHPTGSRSWSSCRRALESLAGVRPRAHDPPPPEEPMVETEPLIRWPQPLIEYLGFAAVFLSAGAVGFRYAALRRLEAAMSGTPAAVERTLVASALARAAALGLAGALLAAGLLASRLPELAARRHVSVSQLVIGSAPLAVQAGLTLVTLAGFALALGRGAFGWPLAAIGVVAGSLRSGFFAQWTRMVNPIHELARGPWVR